MKIILIKSLNVPASVSLISVLLFLIIFSVSESGSSQTYSWRQIPNSIYSFTPFEDICFVDAYTGWTILSDGKTFKTTNGGYNWQLTATLPSSISGVSFMNELSGWVSSRNNVLHATTNGGSNFSLVSNFPPPVPRGLQCINILNGHIIYGCGRETSDPVFIKSTDLGETWISRDLSHFAAGLADCYFTNEYRGFISGSVLVAGFYHTVVLVTTDGGNVWSLGYQGSRQNEQGRRISFADGQTGYIALERVSNPERFVLKTTDGGFNWSELPFPNYNETSIGFVNGMTGWIGGFFNPLIGTTDGGASWFNSNLGQNIMEIFLLRDTIGYACGNYIYKYERTSGINSIGSEVPNKFELLQNYPNPFNPRTTIVFSIPKACRVLIEVFDMAGKKSASSESKYLPPGRYEYAFDGSNFNSGVFIYRIIAGKNIASGKMVLTK